MTVDEALGHADEWIEGVTVYDGLQGWRIACATLAGEVRRLTADIEALKQAAETCGSGAMCCYQAARIEQLEAQLALKGFDAADMATASADGFRSGQQANHFSDAGQMVPARWYMVDKIGMATLCSTRADAEQEAKDATLCYPHMAPHCAVLLAPGACELKTTNA